MKPALFLLFVTLAASGLGATPVFLGQAQDLLEAGDFAGAASLSRQALAAQPQDPDALVIAGTAALYQSLVLKYEESIYKPDVSRTAGPTAKVPAAGVAAAAVYWRQVPALAPDRAYLWGDLAQLAFRAGSAPLALEFAKAALEAPGSDAESLQTAALVFEMNLDWAKASAALAKAGDPAALLYKGLDQWRWGRDGWRDSLKAYAASAGPRSPGSAVAAYLAGPQMRDTEAGYQAAIQVEPTSVAALAVRQKYVDRYPDKPLPRLELARTLSQFGSYGAAQAQFAEIDRRGLTATDPDLAQSVAFEAAWAYQAGDQAADALPRWKALVESRDFFVRTAAAWFLAQDALARGKAAEAKDLWTRRLEMPPEPVKIGGVKQTTRYLPAPIEEPAGSKYATWAAAVYKTLP